MGITTIDTHGSVLTFPIVVPFDRSRVEDDQKCPRLRFWRYEYNGIGLESTKLNQHLLFGGAVHDALRTILGWVSKNDTLPTDEVISIAVMAAQKDMRIAVRDRGLSLEVESIEQDSFTGEFTKVVSDVSWIVEQYCDLLEALVFGWCLIRLPKILDDYRIIEVENEKRLLLHTHRSDVQLVFLSRADALLERRSDSSLVILNFKTTKEARKWWIEQWATDQQTISEVLPIEYERGQIVAGVLIEGLIKGQEYVEYPKGSGNKWHNSPLIWAWHKEGDGINPDEWRAKYDWVDEAGNKRTLGKGFSRVLVSAAYPGGIRGWLHHLWTTEPNTLTGQFVSPPLVSRSSNEITEWLTQIKHREVAIYETKELLNNAPDDAADVIMAESFPKHTGNARCHFPSRCSCYELCWGSAGGDPIGSGLYQIRQPNHPEREQ